MRYLILLFSIFFSLSGLAQNRYFVKFKDKLDCGYSLNSPSAFLSQRAIERRLNQGIEIDSVDLPVSDIYIQQVLDKGCTMNYATKWLNGVVVSADSSAISKVQELGFVIDVKAVYQESSSKICSSELKKFIDSNRDSFDYGNSWVQIQMLNGHLLHQHGFLGDGYHIAILDAGFLNVDIHPAFDSVNFKNQILGTRDFVNPESNIYEESSHGAAVLSTIAANVPNKMIGTAPHAKFWLIRTENSRGEQLIEEYNWAAGAELADSVGVDIVNTSLGYSSFEVTSQSHSYSDMDGNTTPITIAANIASSRGILVVVSAGNDGNSIWHHIASPADSPKVLTIGAINDELNVVGFSSRGPTSDGRIKPDVCALGQLAAVIEGSSDFSFGNGTSFSAPIVAGLSACLWQANPALTSTELLNLIKSSASYYSNPNNDIGYGIPNFAITLKSNAVEQNQIGVYPNPAIGIFYIKVPSCSAEVAQVSMYSVDGNVVESKIMAIGNGIISVPLSAQIERGAYFIKVLVDGKLYVSKLIKM